MWSSSASSCVAATGRLSVRLRVVRIWPMNRPHPLHIARCSCIWRASHVLSSPSIRRWRGCYFLAIQHLAVSFSRASHEQDKRNPAALHVSEK